VNLEGLLSALSTEVDEFPANTAPGSPQGARTPLPAGSRRLSDQTCPTQKQIVRRSHGRV